MWTGNLLRVIHSTVVNREFNQLRIFDPRWYILLAKTSQESMKVSRIGMFSNIAGLFAARHSQVIRVPTHSSSRMTMQMMMHLMIKRGILLCLMMLVRFLRLDIILVNIEDSPFNYLISHLHSLNIQGEPLNNQTKSKRKKASIN